MKIISRDEYIQVIKGTKLSKFPMLGGGIGKHQSCPNDAAHAHQVASGK